MPGPSTPAFQAAVAVIGLKVEPGAFGSSVLSISGWLYVSL